MSDVQTATHICTVNESEYQIFCWSTNHEWTYETARNQNSHAFFVACICKRGIKYTVLIW